MFGVISIVRSSEHLYLLTYYLWHNNHHFCKHVPNIIIYRSTNVIISSSLPQSCPVLYFYALSNLFAQVLFDCPLLKYYLTISIQLFCFFFLFSFSIYYVYIIEPLVIIFC